MIVYDTEIKHGVPGKQEPIEGIKYCKGWDDFAGMGVAVVAAYDYTEDACRVFCDDNLQEFQHLVWSHAEQGEKIVGFNSLKFDNPLVRVHGVDIPDEDSYDLLVEIWKAAGLGPEFVKETHMGFSLDDCIKANFDEYGKTGDGAMAPVLWQQGKIGKVIDYCLSDVWLNKMLLDRVLNEGGIVCPKTGGWLMVENPSGFAGLDEPESEYEWKTARFGVIANYCHTPRMPFSDKWDTEMKSLDKWIEKNKPVKTDWNLGKGVENASA